MMTPQERINAWGAKKYGKPGEYTLELGVGGYVSEVTDASEGIITVYRDRKLVEELDNYSFARVLNELLEQSP